VNSGTSHRPSLSKSFPSVLVPLFDPMAAADINPDAVGIRRKLHIFLTV